jgi:hypothetical protein
MSLLQEIKQELQNIGYGWEKYEVTELDCETVVIHLPSPNSLESRNVMQGFNTPVYRARRRPRSFQEIEVKYRA